MDLPPFLEKRPDHMLLPDFTSSNRLHKLNHHTIFEKRKRKFSLSEVMRKIAQTDKDGALFTVNK